MSIFTYLKLLIVAFLLMILGYLYHAYTRDPRPVITLSGDLFQMRTIEVTCPVGWTADYDHDTDLSLMQSYSDYEYMAETAHCRKEFKSERKFRLQYPEMPKVDLYFYVSPPSNTKPYNQYGVISQ